MGFASRHDGFAAHAEHLLAAIAAHPDVLDTEAAERHYRAALALAEPRGMRPLVAHCHFGLGSVAIAAGHRERGREHFTTAATMYREMGMTFWLDRVSERLAALA